MLEELRRADATVHAVDIGGLRAGPENTTRAKGEDSLFMMADGTGGELYRNFNDLGGVMEQMLDRTSVTYVLVFQPGVTVQEAIDEQDPANTYAYGQTNNRGRYILNNPVARNQGYSVLVYAPDYQPISGDDIVLATDGDPSTKDAGTWELAELQ